MSPLERLGLEVAAFKLLGHKGGAAMLCALIDANGRTLSYEYLSKVKAWHFDDRAALNMDSLRVRVCWLRERLKDVGLGKAITTEFGKGYALPEPARSEIVARLIEVAA